ncbi:MAG: 2-succinyl-5-enolpyruvyl-6-hydroxy-3-cyclohexene-1-carboxylic-acid synthase, partial [Rhodothermia bacterium]
HAPLVAAVASRPLADSLVHFDERGTGFLALGSGNWHRVPAVWITTSGTAVANGFPAVVEASQACVPLILLTADRPFELRGVGANQAIDQVKIFGDYVRWSVDLPTPDPQIPPESVLTLIDQAFARAVGPPAGPVHLNLPFREPLAPVPIDFSVNEIGIARWKNDDQPFTKYIPGSAHPSDRTLTELETAVTDARRGLFILGGLPSKETAKEIVTLASTWGWPVVADVASQARLGAHSEVVVPSPHFGARFHPVENPDVVLRFGSKISSKAINEFLKDHQPATLAVISDDVTRNDPDHCATHHVLSDPAGFCASAANWAGSADADWLPAWKRTRVLNPIFDRLVDDAAGISEPGVARRVTQLIPENHVLYLASSMPIRDVDVYADGSANACWVGANRGASGIDGTIASGVGAGLAANTRATIVCGDLALLHDLNSLALLSARADVVVVLNNDGGGIFSFLPIADHEDLFETWFGTPHGYSFEGAARMFGLRYERPENMSQFARAYADAARATSATLIEVQTDRAENLRLHR